MHGQGTYSFFNGDLYSGSFINGMRSGYGTFIYKNGDKYEGRFLFDKKNGKGILTNKKGITKSVQYELDRFIK